MNYTKIMLAVFLGLLLIKSAQAGGLVTVEIKSIFLVEDSRNLRVCVNRVPEPALNSECMRNPDSPYCAAAGANEQIYLNLDGANGKEMYSMLLAAHTASKNVQLFISNTNQCFIETINILK